MKRAAAVALVALAPVVLAQEPVPGSSVEVVEIDAIVVDGDNKPVTNLTQADFQVFEDGKLQAVQVFVPSGSGRSASISSEETETTSVSAPGGAPPRSIAIVVDNLHIAPGNVDDARQALKRLPRELMTEGDQVALVGTANGVLLQFTDSRADLEKAINRLIAQAPVVMPPHSSQMTPAQAELILRGDRGARKLAAKTILAEPGSVFDTEGPRAALAGAAGGGGGTMTGANDAGKDAAAEDEAMRQARTVLAESLRFSISSLAVVEDVARAMKGRAGRKVILLLSDGFLTGHGTSEDRNRDMLKISDAATRAGAVVYSLDTRGLVTGGGDVTMAGVGVGQEMKAGIDAQSAILYRNTLDQIARDTGGFLVSGTNDLGGGLKRMLEDNASYYLMAYEPTNPKLDGKFRKIKVKLVSHPELQVRTRAGYFARDKKNREPPPATRANLEGPTGGSDVASLLAIPLPGGPIPVALAADPLIVPGSEALVRAHVELGALQWQQQNGRNRASLQLIGSVFDASGEAVGQPFGRQADLDLTDDEVKRAVETGVEFQQAMTLPPGRYEVRLLVREKRLGQTGSAVQGLEVPNLAMGNLEMSGVFLTSAAAGAEAGRADAADPAMYGRFKRGTNLFFQLYLYNAKPAPDGDVVLQAQIWSGNKAIAASKPAAATLAEKNGAPLPESNEMSLEGLSAGPYELRVVAVDRKTRATASRNVPFTLE